MMMCSAMIRARRLLITGVAGISTLAGACRPPVEHVPTRASPQAREASDDLELFTFIVEWVRDTYHDDRLVVDPWPLMPTDPSKEFRVDRFADVSRAVFEERRAALRRLGVADTDVETPGQCAGLGLASTPGAHKDCPKTETALVAISLARPGSTYAPGDPYLAHHGDTVSLENPLRLLRPGEPDPPGRRTVGITRRVQVPEGTSEMEGLDIIVEQASDGWHVVRTLFLSGS